MLVNNQMQNNQDTDSISKTNYHKQIYKNSSSKDSSFFLLGNQKGFAVRIIITIKFKIYYKATHHDDFVN